MVKKNKKIQHQRMDQDISWITKTIMREFGTNGVKKIDKLLTYKENPFSSLQKIKKKIIAFFHTTKVKKFLILNLHKLLHFLKIKICIYICYSKNFIMTK